MEYKASILCFVLLFKNDKKATSKNLPLQVYSVINNKYFILLVLNEDLQMVFLFQQRALMCFEVIPIWCIFKDVRNKLELKIADRVG